MNFFLSSLQRALFAMLLLATRAQAQSFEVATVRANPKADPNQGHWSLPNSGVFNASGLPLTWLIRLAYNVDASQIANKPAWLETDLFDVAAKPEAGIALTREELRPRLQDLLARRFHLVAHRETRVLPGFALVLAKDGPKLPVGRPDARVNSGREVTRGHIEGTSWDTPYLAQMLTPFAGFPVVDQTGLKGHYDVKLIYAPDTDVESTLPSLFTAIRETLGLELRPQKVPVETIVIDHVERVPTEN